MKISVITINYNNLGGLKKTVASVISQTYNNIEYIVVDGGSSDGSAEYLLSMQKHFSYAVSEKDNGIYNAMNKGIAHSSGDYLIFMNSGDEFFNQDVVNDIFARNIGSADIIVGSVVDEHNGYGKVRHPAPLSNFEHEQPFCHQACFIRGNLMRSYLYDETYRYVADDAFLYRCYSDKKSFVVVNRIIALYNVDGMSQDSRYAEAVYQERCRVRSAEVDLKSFRHQLAVNRRKDIIRLFLPQALIDFICGKGWNANKWTKLNEITQISDEIKIQQYI